MCQILFIQIVMEDPLKPLDLNGYGDTVGVLPYQEVIRLGDLSSKSGFFPKPDDTAIIMYTSGSTGINNNIYFFKC